MAVHGRFRKPCPVCGSPVQRIVYADNETNYCARCQTGGKVLADRALSRLLKASWPRPIDELEERLSARGSMESVTPAWVIMDQVWTMTPITIAASSSTQPTQAR